MASWRTWVLAVSISAFLTLSVEKESVAGVQVDVNIGLPSPLLFPAPPPVVVIPGTYVYLIPDIDVSVLFYHGYWYRPHGKRWFRAHHYEGPWVHVVPGHVPRALMRLPPHHHSVPHGYHRISHGELEANWGKWERKKHWNKDKQWKAGWKGHEGNGGAKYKHEREQRRDNHGRHEGPRD